jgi:hypothetical protein
MARTALATLALSFAAALLAATPAGRAALPHVRQAAARRHPAHLTSRHGSTLSSPICSPEFSNSISKMPGIVALNDTVTVSPAGASTARS